MTRSEYLRNRRQEALANGECTVCRKRAVVGKLTRCEVCLGKERAHSARIYGASERHTVAVLKRLNFVLSKPLVEPDVLLAKPFVRLLRALRWHDWVDPADLDLGNWAQKPLRRMTDDGKIERDGRLVRITADGKRYLESLLARTRPDPIVFELDCEVE